MFVVVTVSTCTCCLQVCKDAGVELHTVPLTKQYWDRVVSHSISEIKAGRTPNPDVLCNSRSDSLSYQHLHLHARVGGGMGGGDGGDGETNRKEGGLGGGGSILIAQQSGGRSECFICLYARICSLMLACSDALLQHSCCNTQRLPLTAYINDLGIVYFVLTCHP